MARQTDAKAAAAGALAGRAVPIPASTLPEAAVGLRPSAPEPSPGWPAPLTIALGRRRLLALLVTAPVVLAALQNPSGLQAQPAAPPPAIRAPIQSSTSLRFLAVADTGSGDSRQQAVADRMAERHRQRPVDLVILAGDNLYPEGSLSRIVPAFERPYRQLLAARVPFHAVLGNHDIRTGNGDPQIAYPGFGMKGRWYNLRRGPVEFFLLDTNMNARWQKQLPWLQRALAASTAPWKVVVGHHPIYSSGFYGDDPAAIARLTPLFARHGVQLYINGHEHHYERSRPFAGTTYLQVGGGGAYLRPVVPNGRSARALSRHSFAEISASEEALEIVGWDARGERIDRVVLRR